MNEDFIEKRKQQAELIAQKFEAMAARIRLNGTDQFGGAFLLVPPTGVGKPVELLTLSDVNPGNFWMSVKLYVDDEYKGLQDQMLRQRSFG